MKIELTEADRDRVWRLATSTWLHYVWEDNQWMTYPGDPRMMPGCTVGIRRSPLNGKELPAGKPAV